MRGSDLVVEWGVRVWRHYPFQAQEALSVPAVSYHHLLPLKVIKRDFCQVGARLLTPGSSAADAADRNRPALRAGGQGGDREDPFPYQKRLVHVYAAHAQVCPQALRLPPLI
jgi:hypothetical protein